MQNRLVAIMYVNRKGRYFLLCICLPFFISCSPLSARFERDFTEHQKESMHNQERSFFQIDHPRFCSAVIVHYRNRKNWIQSLELSGLIKERYQSLHFFWIEKNYIICEFQEREGTPLKHYYVYYKGNYFFAFDSHFKNLKKLDYDPLFFLLNELKAEGIRWSD